MHHRRWKLYGDPHYQAIIRGDDTKRFYSKVAMDPSGCNLWLGSTNRYGYGEFRLPSGNKAAHRWAFEHKHGPIPDEMTVDHLCGVRRCVNVDHMELVTLAENVRRGHARAMVARTACRRGHEYTDASTYWYGRHRQCRICAAMREEIRDPLRRHESTARGIQG